jgi:predicted nucleic acid-binding protein
MEAGNLLIDTSIIIDHLRKKNKKKSRYYHIVDKYALFISTITVFELYAGAVNDQKKQDILNILEYVTILPFTTTTAQKSGELYLSLLKENQVIESKDLFIAATALSNGMPLMTLNLKHFERVKELNVLE